MPSRRRPGSVLALRREPAARAARSQKGDAPDSDGNCYVYDGCPADGQVELCAFQNLQHAWAGAPVCEGCIGSGAGFKSATKLQWEFFKKYAW
jgi:poly(3-hydroxybutyrate) depolymerase